MVEILETALPETGNDVLHQEIKDLWAENIQLKAALFHSRDADYASFSPAELLEAVPEIKRGFSEGLGKVLLQKIGCAYKGYARADRAGQAAQQATLYNQLRKKYIRDAQRSGYSMEEVRNLLLEATVSSKKNRAKYVDNAFCDEISDLQMRAFVAFHAGAKKVRGFEKVLFVWNEQAQINQPFAFLFCHDDLKGEALCIDDQGKQSVVSLSQGISSILGLSPQRGLVVSDAKGHQNVMSLDGQRSSRRGNLAGCRCLEVSTRNVAGHYFKEIYTELAK